MFFHQLFQDVFGEIQQHQLCTESSKNMEIANVWKGSLFVCCFSRQMSIEDFSIFSYNRGKSRAAWIEEYFDQR